jgi:hypothetical protein
MALDLRDPILAAHGIFPFDEIPLCSYLSCDAFPQLYRIDLEARRVILLDRDEPLTEVRFPELSRPLPEKPLRLTEMVESDYPTTEDAYWRICDEFLGGGRFIRVVGPPLWVDSVAAITCESGRPMPHVCGLGWEVDSRCSGLMDGEPVFFGESALYWFVCADCLKLGVMAQPTS